MKATGPVLALTAMALLMAALPDLLRHGQPRQLLAPTLAASTEASPSQVDPELRPLAMLEDGLLQRLEEADQAWIPRAEPLPEGGIRYLYKRRPGDPPLSLPQIRALIAHPPSQERERQAIVAMLTTLEAAGAAVGLIEPIKPGAAAEWDPQARTLRIRPDVQGQGSVEFARVLNHETIHVAQSCAAGGVGATPRPLGLIASAHSSADRTPEALGRLQDPVYADLSPAERRMEQEAYSLQNRLELGVKLLRIHCLDGQPG